MINKRRSYEIKLFQNFFPLKIMRNNVSQHTLYILTYNFKSWFISDGILTLLALSWIWENLVFEFHISIIKNVFMQGFQVWIKCCRNTANLKWFSVLEKVLRAKQISIIIWLSWNDLHWSLTVCRTNYRQRQGVHRWIVKKLKVAAAVKQLKPRPFYMGAPPLTDIPDQRSTFPSCILDHHATYLSSTRFRKADTALWTMPPPY